MSKVTRLVSPRDKARASGQKLYPPFCWISSFSRSAAEFLEGGGGRAGPHTALWAVNKELIKISDQNSSSLRTRWKLIRDQENN